MSTLRITEFITIREGVFTITGWAGSGESISINCGNKVGWSIGSISLDDLRAMTSASRDYLELIDSRKVAHG